MTKYFRRRAEDMMFVEDIETTLKDFIRAAFHVSDDADQQKLPAVIADMTDSDLRKKFQGALNHYGCFLTHPFRLLMIQPLFPAGRRLERNDSL
ncbi:MAG: hypothetical protein ACJ8DI_04305 [Ktedonobacteraceae bacterium]